MVPGTRVARIQFIGGQETEGGIEPASLALIDEAQVFVGVVAVALNLNGRQAVVLGFVEPAQLDQANRKFNRMRPSMAGFFGRSGMRPSMAGFFGRSDLVEICSLSAHSIQEARMPQVTVIVMKS